MSKIRTGIPNPNPTLTPNLPHPESEPLPNVSVSKPQYITAYAVIRVDGTADSDARIKEYQGVLMAGPSHVSVKEIVMSADEARSEVVRLTALNEGKGCAYYWQATHLFLEGGSHGSRGTPNSAPSDDSN